MSSSARQDELAVPVEPVDHSQGPGDAPVTLVEYGDYECPYCGKAFPIIRRLRQELKDGLRIVFRHYPQNSIHPHAGVAAQAAEAAGAQGRFWEMHDLLFENQDELGGADLVQYALRAGLEIYRFEADLASERFAERVGRDQQSGQASGIHITPTLFINGSRYQGPLEYDALLAAIRKAGPGASQTG